MPTISTTIITKNEADNIAPCIESVVWTDEIIILDCGSTDNTKQICEKYAPKLKFYETDWPGYGEQKNRALKLATSDWILSIDADERVTSALKNEILQALEHDAEKYTAYQMPRQNYFLNKPLKHCCGKGEASSPRLAKKGYCEFSNDIVHEKTIITGNIGKLQSELSHFPWKNLEDLLNKTNIYSTLGALNLKQRKKKSSFAMALIRAKWAFIRTYFLRLGFLDGWPGFIIALNAFEETFYKYAKFSE
ncbi:MAG: glycosyltransferase family 2 protein, partial [Gammaproteobacteria bacterium]|nr:glycosyltransferase family 2 protein [Gammaproteobacteria bacterium]